MIKESFGKRVRKLRISAGISQDKFALAIGMDRTYLASVENGKRNISIENISKIAKGLNITLEKLFKEVE
jgi:regulatory protein munI